MAVCCLIWRDALNEDCPGPAVSAGIALLPSPAFWSSTASRLSHAGSAHALRDMMEAAYMSRHGSGGTYDRHVAAIWLIPALPGSQDNHICSQTTGQGATKHFPKGLYRLLQPKGWKCCQEYVKSITTSYASSLQNITLRSVLQP